MATIVATTAINATTMAANWTTGVGNNSAKWLAKYLAPKALFNANPTSAQANWIAGCIAAAAANAYATGMANVNLTTVANNATAYGAANYAASGAKKAANYAAVTPALAAALSTVRAAVLAMPNTTPQDRINRMTTWATMMATYKGTF
jgi:hypothetical protein